VEVCGDGGEGDEAPAARLTSLVVLATKSRTNTSSVVSPSSGSRFVAPEVNATKRPSPETADAPEPKFPLAPLAPAARLTSVVVCATRSRTRTSKVVSPSSGWRFVATEVKATKRPSAETAGSKEPSLPLAPVAPAARLTSVVVPATKSRTNTSVFVSVSSGCRFEALEWKATKRPSAETAGKPEKSFPLAPAAPAARLTSAVVFACRSRTNTSAISSPSSGCRFDALEWKATKRPSAETAGKPEKPLPLAPVAPVARLTSVVVPASRSRTYTSKVASPSSGSRFVAADPKAMNRPSPEILGPKDSSLPLAPLAPVARLTRSTSSFAAQAWAPSPASTNPRHTATTHRPRPAAAPPRSALPGSAPSGDVGSV
jgi:hypothetical protein